jgi:hypothetical protein
MRDLSGLHDTDRLQVDRPTRTIKEADSLAQKDRHDDHENLVDETSLDALSSNIGAEHQNALAGCGLGGRSNRTPDITADEGNRR